MRKIDKKDEKIKSLEIDTKALKQDLKKAEDYIYDLESEIKNKVILI